ncbi:MAG: FAD-binding protein [Betaproteobacteria bacterium]|nr:FAD-binding protein [Betaproteobacteria bacterium]
MHLTTDVLIIGAGGAGMYAAIEAARRGATVLLIDRSLIGRSGGTVMAQMTVAVAVGEEAPDHWEHHLADTLAAGRGLCDPDLAQLLCEDGVECIREMDTWGVGWARANGHLSQVMAPGHDRPRCVYVDFLNTGPAVSRTLRTQVIRTPGIRRVGDLVVTDLVVKDSICTGAQAIHNATGAAVSITARATIIATGGLTRLYRRNSASANMGGDGYALALRAGAELIDMEFVQFFPIGHLAPRMIGMDPIMWDPFRYKLGGRLLNGAMEEFTHRYGATEGGKYVLTRDLATYAIIKEAAAGRGSPHGGAYLSFQHLSREVLKEAFGPVIDRIAKNGIDLTQQPIEVAPIAHYHMGGIQVDRAMRTSVEGLFAAGEAVGGANGANRLSGNAITEALAFGRVAGRSAAARVQATANASFNGAMPNRPSPGRAMRFNPAETLAQLQDVMQDDVGPFRTKAGLERALVAIRSMRAEVGDTMPQFAAGHDASRLDWLDLRSMLQVAETVAHAALLRTESRGAHQREDFPGMDDAWRINQTIRLDSADIAIARRPSLHQPAKP